MNKTRRTIWRLCTVMLLVGLVVDVDARIRKRPDLLTAEWDDLNDEYLSVSNPLYEENENSGVNPLYEPKSMSFDPGEFYSGSPVRFELQMDAELPVGISVSDDAYAFDIKLIDLATGSQVTEFPKGLTFRLEIPGLTDGDVSDAALGYLDESSNPPELKVEDSLLAFETAGDGIKYVVCKSTHLTTFVIGPSSTIPEPASILFVVFGGLILVRRRIAPCI